MSCGKEEEAVTFVWKIENFSCSKENHWYYSPGFYIKGSGVMHCFGLKRVESDNGDCLHFAGMWHPSGRWLEVNISDVEISLLASDGSVFVCKERQEVRYGDHSAEISSYFVPKLNDYLSGDNLTVVCVLWNSEGRLLQSERILARTRIGVEHVSFVWPLKCFGSLQRFEDRVFYLEQSVNQARGCQFVLHLDDQYSIIIKQNNVEHLKKLRVSILDATGKVVEFSEYLSKDEKVQRNTLVQLVRFSSKTTQKIMTNRDFYLRRGVLSLLFEGVFQGVTLDGYIEGESRILVHSCVNLVPLLTHSERGISFLNDRNVLKSDAHGSAPTSIIKDFRTMFEQNLLSDYTLETPSKSFPVHKNVLCARSPVFHAMLTSEMKEGFDDFTDIPDVEADTLHRFLLFLYTDEFDCEMNWEDASKLYYAADKYEVLSLMDRCGSFLKSSLSTTNACDILALTDVHQNQDFKTTVLEYIWRHEYDIVNTEHWMKFEAENGPLALETLRELHIRNQNRF